MTRSSSATSIKNRLAADIILQAIGQAGPAYQYAGQTMGNVVQPLVQGAAEAAFKAGYGVPHPANAAAAAKLAARIAGPAGAVTSVVGPALVGIGAYKRLTDKSQEREQLRLDQIAAAERAHKHAVDLAYHQENARTPGKQAEGRAKLLEAQGYLEKSRAEAAKTTSEVGEAQAQDMMNFARSIYGTGLRA
jgi:hypothetical protein